MNPEARGFPGLKVTQSPQAARLWPELHRVLAVPGSEQLVVEPEGHIIFGHNSGIQALNLALQFGAREIALVGFDYSLAHGIHWHGRHPVGMNNPRQAAVDKWRELLDRQSGFLRAIGADVVIASPGSTLTAYQRVDLLDWVAEGAADVDCV